MATVKEILGHQKIDMTLRYAHLAPVHKREAMEILGSRMVTSWSREVFEGQAENRKFENRIEKIRLFRKRRGTQMAEGAGLLKRKIPDEKSKPRR
ncbi:MAG: hypothetical protein HWN66_14825 [Candidatus Helarchaeota archaeon]|nr:hypothetical protein [Candidatus Helarchaeota archaeon]